MVMLKTLLGSTAIVMSAAFGLSACSTVDKTVTATTKAVASLVAGPVKWESQKLANPESVVYDAKNKVLYVSEKAGDTGKGYISKLSLDGKVLNEHWVDGLKQPKGLQIVGNSLYASDVTNLVKIDIPTGHIAKVYRAKGAKYLNDTAADMIGNVYVSDMQTNAIYRLSTKGKMSLWLKTNKLDNPNGLYIDGDTMYVAAWGPFKGSDFVSAKPGHVLKVNLKTKKVMKVTPKPLGNLDGIQEVGKDGLYLSDWIAGKLYLVNKNTGVVLKTVDLAKLLERKTAKGVGDIGYVGATKMLYLPMDNNIVAIDAAQIFKK